ncbi:MAG: LCP family protein [Huintestinicola sp.]
MSKKSAKIGLTYFITIIASLLLIGGLGYVILDSYLNSEQESELAKISEVGNVQVTTAANSGEYAPTENDARTLLVVCSYDKKITDTCIAVIRFIPTQNKAVVMPLQTDICTEVNGKQNTIYEFYRIGGAGDLKTAVEEALQVSIDKYIVFSDESFSSFTDYMGNISYNVPYNLINDTDSTEPYIIKSGDQILDSTTLRRVLTFPLYKQGEEYRAKVVGTVFTELLNSGSRGILRSSLDTVFSNTINSDIETDITKYDYEESKPAMEYVLSKTTSPFQLVIPSGAYNENNCYVLDDTFVQAVPRWFGIE